MKYYLIVYDRATGRLLEPPREYLDAQRRAALIDRFARELSERSRPQVEVVVLGAESLQALERTHSRYFKTASEILAAAPLD